VCITLATVEVGGGVKSALFTEMSKKIKIVSAGNKQISLKNKKSFFIFITAY